MGRIHEMVNRHLGVITAAGGDPDNYIPEEFLAEFELLGDSLWNDFRLLTPLVFRPSVVDLAVSDAVEKYRDLLRLLVGEQIYKAPVMGEFVSGALVQYGDIRPLLVALGGGSTDATIELQGGIGTGQIFADAARDQGMDLGNEKIWLYGYNEQPRRTFNGHLQMDGLVFSKWDDDGLLVAPQDRWIRVSHYFPGDHYGCSCIVAPYAPNLGADLTVTFN